jgi:hypothetical protein
VIFSDLEDGPGQGSLFPQVAKLSEQFSISLPTIQCHSKKLLSAPSAITAWRSTFTHLKAPMPVSWTALKGQFGAGFDSMLHFRPSFLGNLRLALAVYRSAKVDVTERGVELFPSRPPVAPRQVTAGRVPTSTPGPEVTAGRVLSLDSPPLGRHHRQIRLRSL